MSFLSFVILGAFLKIERISVSLRNEIRKNIGDNYNRRVLRYGVSAVGFCGSVTPDEIAEKLIYLIPLSFKAFE